MILYPKLPGVSPHEADRSIVVCGTKEIEFHDSNSVGWSGKLNVTKSGTY
jgi:hypothetical protein